MIGMQCPQCLRYRGNLTCDTFEGGIPVEILFGRHDHRKPYHGEGKLFQPFPATVLPEEVADLTTVPEEE